VKRENNARARRKPIHPRVRFRVLQAANFRCAYCGKLDEVSDLQIDHVVPVALGGTNDIANLVAACRLCNQGKGAMSLSPNTQIPDPACHADRRKAF
jgi:5-methylcytosine-specific restriction endonuclease McrA